MKKLEHKFVDTMPGELEEGIVYVSIRFRIVSHKCCCGCGNEVVTNISPSGWQLTYDGQTISLYPSIGNWTLPCRSHYWIIENAVQWSPDWSEERIRRAMERDGYEADEKKGELPIQNKIGVGKKSIWRKLASLFN